MKKSDHRTGLLMDEPSCSWQEHDVPLRDRGVRLSWLIEFVESVYRNEREPLVQAYTDQSEAYDRAISQQRASENFPDRNIPWVDAVFPKEPKLVELTTRAFVAEHVLTLTESLKAPLYARVPPTERGRPTVFLSHAWDSVLLAGIPVVGFQTSGAYGTLDAFDPKGIVGVKEEFVWIDFVCYNQHKLTEETIAFDMESIVQSIGKVAFAVTPVPLFNRIWCLWELLSQSRTGCASKFCAAAGFRGDKRVIVNDFFGAFTTIAAANATKQEDLDKLLSAIIAHFGSTVAADVYIVNLMKDGMAHPWYELSAQ